jgi:hypothetical protein
VFGRLTNSPCNQIESSTQRFNKHNSGWFSVQIVPITGGCKAQSSSMPGGLFLNRFYLRVLTVSVSNSGAWEPHKFSSGYMYKKKSAKRKPPVENPRKIQIENQRGVLDSTMQTQNTEQKTKKSQLNYRFKETLTWDFRNRTFILRLSHSVLEFITIYGGLGTE